MKIDGGGGGRLFKEGGGDIEAFQVGGGGHNHFQQGANFALAHCGNQTRR